jgi:hypothetical protein
VIGSNPSRVTRTAPPGRLGVASTQGAAVERANAKACPCHGFGHRHPGDWSMCGQSRHSSASRGSAVGTSPAKAVVSPGMATRPRRGGQDAGQVVAAECCSAPHLAPCLHLVGEPATLQCAQPCSVHRWQSQTTSAACRRRLALPISWTVSSRQDRRRACAPRGNPVSERARPTGSDRAPPADGHGLDSAMPSPSAVRCLGRPTHA